MIKGSEYFGLSKFSECLDIEPLLNKKFLNENEINQKNKILNLEISDTAKINISCKITSTELNVSLTRPNGTARKGNQNKNKMRNKNENIEFSKVRKIEN